MAELILTEEEKSSLTFLEWDDESLGKAVKKVALITVEGLTCKGESLGDWEVKCRKKVVLT